MRRQGAGSGERYAPVVGESRCWGFTLVDLIVVLAILGLVVGVSGLALFSLKAPRESEWIRELRRARAEAIRTGRPIRASQLVPRLTASYRPLPPSTAPYRPLPPLFLPDARAIGSGVDPLTGEPRHASR